MPPRPLLALSTRLAGHQLLTPAEVTVLFGVNSRTLRCWTRQGLLPAQRTLGGHHRYPVAAVARCLPTTRE